MSLRLGRHVETCLIMSRIAGRAAPATDAAPGLALLADGYRPFFVLAGLMAAIWVPLWLAIQQGAASSASPLPANVWHGHEMIFGYAVAVLSGFLLTAGRNWTGLPTARGAHLAALALLWLAGRIVLLADIVPPAVAAAIDLAYLPALAATLAAPLLRARNYRNLVFLVILAALFTLSLLTYLSAWGSVGWDSQRIFRVALDLFALVIALIGGRIIPSFTRNALPKAEIRPQPWLETPAMAALVLLAVLDLAAEPGLATGIVALAAAAMHGLRLSGWGSLATRRTPILWVLHAGYAWLVVGLALRGLTALDAVPAAAALHALGAGAIGTITMAMMTRVALGHAGRPLVAARPTVLAYAMVILAAALRVGASFLDGPGHDHALMAAGALWSLAFLLFLLVYVPILIAPRRV
jgi:uncharacterized protein involved in response to NO